MFVKELLNDNPLANAEIVNAAWRAAGMSGSISTSLVSNVRSRMGLSGNRRGGRRTGTKATGTRQGRPSMQMQAGANGSAPTLIRGRKNNLLAIELEIDRLLMKVVEIGTLHEAEAELRKARRQLYPGLVARS
jgi:hypothetical protein